MKGWESDNGVTVSINSIKSALGSQWLLNSHHDKAWKEEEGHRKEEEEKKKESMTDKEIRMERASAQLTLAGWGWRGPWGDWWPLGFVAAVVVQFQVWL